MTHVRQDIDPPFVLPINLTELMTGLLGTDRATGYVLFDNTIIPPGATITYTVPIPDKVVSGRTVSIIGVPFEFAAQPDPDYQIALNFTIDGKPFLTDTSMVAGLYTEPMNMLRDYALSWYAKDYFSASFTNTGSTDATISFRFVFAAMIEDDYKKIVWHYAERIKDWLLEKDRR